MQTGSVRALVYAASTRMALFAYSSLVLTTLKLLRWVSESMLRVNLNSHLTFTTLPPPPYTMLYTLAYILA